MRLIERVIGSVTRNIVGHIVGPGAAKPWSRDPLKGAFQADKGRQDGDRVPRGGMMCELCCEGCQARGGRIEALRTDGPVAAGLRLTVDGPVVNEGTDGHVGAFGGQRDPGALRGRDGDLPGLCGATVGGGGR